MAVSMGCLLIGAVVAQSGMFSDMDQEFVNKAARAGFHQSLARRNGHRAGGVSQELARRIRCVRSTEV